MTLYKILKYIAIALGALGVILFIWLLTKGDAEITDSGDLQQSILNPLIYLTYVIGAVAVVSVLAFVVVRFFRGNIKETLISLGAFILVFLIAFISAGSEPIEFANGASISGQGAKWMDTGLIMFYILGVVAVVVMIMSSFKKLTFRN